MALMVVRPVAPSSSRSASRRIDCRDRNVGPHPLPSADRSGDSYNQTWIVARDVDGTRAEVRAAVWLGLAHAT